MFLEPFLHQAYSLTSAQSSRLPRHGCVGAGLSQAFSLMSIYQLLYLSPDTARTCEETRLRLDLFSKLSKTFRSSENTGLSRATFFKCFGPDAIPWHRFFVDFCKNKYPKKFFDLCQD
ncbi:MAG: hypothetical protein ACFCU6_06215, partial [Balneolaceae bacterium]